MNIFCGTDFSANAKRAGTAAAALAAKISDTLHLVHAFDADAIEPITPAVRVSLCERLQERLEVESRRLLPFGPSIQSNLLTGPASNAILAQVNTATTRLVVVSSLGSRKPGRRLIGSVAEQIAESSSVPTLVVRQEEPVVEWASGRRPLRVLCAYDFSSPARAALGYLKNLRQFGSLEIVVAQVDWPPAEKRRLGIRGTQPLDSNQPELQRLLERDLKARVTPILGEQDVRILVEPGWGRPDVRLVELAEKEHADLIVIGTHQRHGVNRLWQSSISRGILRQASMNVLIVPRRAAPTAPSIPELKRVLVTTDLSDLGNQAIPLAYSTLPRGGQVKLVTVIPPWELPGPLVPKLQPRRLTRKEHGQRITDSLKQLQSLVPPEGELRDVATEIEVVEGRDAAEAIQQAAERYGADLVCLASHGRSGVVRAILGSVAQKVLLGSRSPVLIVRSQMD